MITPFVDEILILETLKQVIDPEINCNIVDLGLIYGTEINDGHLTVYLTLTTKGCPMHESIAWGVQNVLLALPGIDEVEVELVWDPPWSPARLSPAGRELLGISEE
jgi:metal-sulfur cluster biosynthetic enzyme